MIENAGVMRKQADEKLLASWLATNGFSATLIETSIASAVAAGNATTTISLSSQAILDANFPRVKLNLERLGYTVIPGVSNLTLNW